MNLGLLKNGVEIGNSQWNSSCLSLGFCLGSGGFHDPLAALC